MKMMWELVDTNDCSIALIDPRCIESIVWNRGADTAKITMTSGQLLEVQYAVAAGVEAAFREDWGEVHSGISEIYSIREEASCPESTSVGGTAHKMNTDHAMEGAT